MNRSPTYTARELKEKVMQVNDIESYKILASLIDEEIDLYSAEELTIVMQASMMLFTKSLLLGSIKL